MLDKILKHIHYYYIKPRKGAPPWWLNLLVLLTSLILVCFIWQPIKVFDVSGPISFSEGKGDSVYVVERSWVSDRSDYANWMKMKFNDNYHWCYCSFSECSYKSTLSTRYEIRNIKRSKILLINHKYCLVTEVGDSDYRLSLSNPIINKRIHELGPIEEYAWYKFFLGLFLLVYLMFVYKDK